MNYHTPKPFFRESRKTWYVEISGRQVNLGRDKAAAFQRYFELMANPPEERKAVIERCGGSKICDLFDSFLEWLQNNRSPATYGWYQYRLQRFIDRYPDMTVEQLKPFHVQEWADSYKDHSVTTTRNYLRTVKRCMKWATNLGYIDKDPIAALPVPASSSRDVYLPRDEFERLLTFTPDPNLRDLMIATYETGCRPQESLRLEIRHVDLKLKRWVFPKTESKGKKAPRIIYLTDTAVEITKRLIDGRTSGYVFRNAKDFKWTVSAVNCSFSRIRNRLGKLEMKGRKISISDSELKSEMKRLRPTCKRKGKEVTKTVAELRCEAKQKLTRRIVKDLAPKYSLYALRHSWETNALQSGVDSLTVAILMGHKDPSMLARVYQHLRHNPEHLLKEARKAVG